MLELRNLYLLALVFPGAHLWIYARSFFHSFTVQQTTYVTMSHKKVSYFKTAFWHVGVLLQNRIRAPEALNPDLFLESLRSSDEPAMRYAGQVVEGISAALQGSPDAEWCDIVCIDACSGAFAYGGAANRLTPGNLGTLRDLSGLGRYIDENLDPRTNGVLVETSPEGIHTKTTILGIYKREAIVFAMIGLITGSTEIDVVIQLTKEMHGYQKVLDAKAELSELVQLNAEELDGVKRYQADLSKERAVVEAKLSLDKLADQIERAGLTSKVEDLVIGISNGDVRFHGQINFAVNGGLEAYISEELKEHPDWKVLEGVAINGNAQVSGINPQFATFYENVNK